MAKAQETWHIEVETVRDDGVDTELYDTQTNQYQTLVPGTIIYRVYRGAVGMTNCRTRAEAEHYVWAATTPQEPLSALFDDLIEEERLRRTIGPDDSTGGTPSDER